MRPGASGDVPCTTLQSRATTVVPLRAPGRNACLLRTVVRNWRVRERKTLKSYLSSNFTWLHNTCAVAGSASCTIVSRSSSAASTVNNVLDSACTCYPTSRRRKLTDEATGPAAEMLAWAKLCDDNPNSTALTTLYRTAQRGGVSEIPAYERDQIAAHLDEIERQWSGIIAVADALILSRGRITGDEALAAWKEAAGSD